MSAFQHLKTVNKHRKLVRQGCFAVGLYKQGLLHDMSKYSPTEFLVGAKYYQGTRSPNNAEREDIGYSSAWLHHKGRNKHHYEYWIDYSIHNAPPGMHGMMPAPMPIKYIVEMLMDRVAACKVYNGEAYTNSSPMEYYNKGLDPAPMHPKTRAFLELFLRMLEVWGEEDTYAFIKENIVSRAKKFDDKDSLQFCLDFCERGQRRLKKDSLQHKGYLK